MAIVPAGHRVLIRPDEISEKTSGGIILAQTTKDREQQATMRGVVVEVGENAWKAFDDGKPWAKVGDKVVFRKYAGEKVPEGDNEYRVVNDEDILCVIK